MSGYLDCACCGETFIGEDYEVCDSCHAAGCDPDEDGNYYECEIPQCPEIDEDGCDCNTRASWMSDNRWHANCDEPCPNAGKSWDDEQAAKRFSKPQRKPPIVFRVPAAWQRMSRIDERLRHAVHETRWDPTSRFVGDKPLLPCPPYLTSHVDGGYPVYYIGVTNTSERCLCAKCASKAEYEDERIVSQRANWENPDLYCEECNERIESAYADEEDEEEDANSTQTVAR